MVKKRIIEVSLLLSLIFLTNSVLRAQESIPGIPTICYGSEIHSPIHITLPYENRKIEKKSNFEITFEGFPEQAKAPFLYAVGIWETYLESPIPIRVTAKWNDLELNILASTGAKKLYRGFQGAIQRDVWYPVALAERIAGKELNSTSEADIEVVVNKNVAWYLGTDGKTSSSAFDFVSVILHELAHGLGFSSSGRVNEQFGILTDDKYFHIYDLLLERRDRNRLSSTKDSTRTMYNHLISNDLYLYSPTGTGFNSNKFPKVYAPSSFIPGSSLSHLDIHSFQGDDANSLMFPNFSMGKSIHIPGNIVLGILADLGWNYSKENPYTIVVYPNPSTGVFNVSVPININAIDLSIVDVSGKTILNTGKTILNSPNVMVDLSTFSPGVYILVFASQRGEIRRRIILSN